MKFLIGQRLIYRLFESVTQALLSIKISSKDQACLNACGQGSKTSAVDLSLHCKGGSGGADEEG